MCPTDPRFIYASGKDVVMLEFREGESSKTCLFSADDAIVSFDLDWNMGWLYWANPKGRVQRTSLTQVQTEMVQIPLPGVFLLFFFD